MIATPTAPARIQKGLGDLRPPPPTAIPVVDGPPSPEQVEAYSHAGVARLRGFLSPDELAEAREVFQSAGDKGPIDGLSDDQMKAENFGGRDEMLRRFPRMLHPHRHPEEAFGRLSMRYMLDATLAETMRRLMGADPLAAQSMFYFKPPGARGQGLHQDNNPLAVSPGTCHAAWISLDDADEANGTLIVVPGTANWPILCDANARGEAEEAEFFDGGSLQLPEGCQIVPAELDAGDVLLFNGSLVHGSPKNRTSDRWRRSLIFHYVPDTCEEVAAFYHPLLDMQGREVDRRPSATGGPCANWPTA